MAFKSDDYIINNGNVILVEPNSVNVNRNQVDGVQFVNGIPQYQDMYIFAELTAESKGRTVIVNGNTSSTTSKPINLMGVNQDNSSDNPNYLNYTTNYYDGSTGNRTQYEGFGISNIKIVVNASFVPQVSIQFVDVRGLTFFNQKDSPYRILFDFPPPTFKLTVKGYYGNAITYQLHLVKYTSEFSSENGNFIIDAQFVAMTFAPLSDILLRYVVNFALMTDKGSMKPDSADAPVNTYELILKLKNLYSAVSDKLKTDTESIKYDGVLKEIENVSLAVSSLQAYNENVTLLTNGTPQLIVKSKKPDDFSGKNPALQPNETDILRKIVDLREYDTIIKNQETTGTDINLKDRLYIVYQIGTDDVSQKTTLFPLSTTPTIPFSFGGDTGRIKEFKGYLSSYREQLVKNTNTAIASAKDIPDPKPFFNNYTLDGKEVSTQYVGLDITDYYYKLYKKNLKLNETKTELGEKIGTKINNMVSQRLGMTPSIYNIFEIILGDVDKFFNLLRKTAQDAEAAHEVDKAIIASANDSNDVKNLKIYAFPLLIEKKPVYGGEKEERIAPIELSKKVSFPELTLVQDFINSFPDQANLAVQYNLRDEQNDDGTYKWIPVSPFDSTLGGAVPASPYVGISDDVMTEIYRIMLKRFYIMSQGTIYDDFYSTDKKNAAHKAYLSLYAEAEAANLASALIASKNSDVVKDTIAKYKDKPDDFYKAIAKVSDTYDSGNINLYDFPQNDPKYFPVTPSDTSTGRVFVNKNNSEFTGVFLYPRDITIQTTPDTEGSTKPIDKFNTNAKSSGIFKSNTAEAYYEFTQENVIYIKDITQENAVVDGTSLKTRYLYSNPFARNADTSSLAAYSKYPDSQKIAYEGGNKSFGGNRFSDKSKLNSGDFITNIWVSELSHYDQDDKIYDKIIKSGSTLGATILLSNFGTTLSPFNMYPTYLNDIVFSTPAAVEVPAFLPLYVGALVCAIEGDSNTGIVPFENQILEFFTGATGADGIGSTFINKGYYVLADLHDVKTHLSEKDKYVFKTAFIEFYKGGDYDSLQGQLYDLYTLVSGETTNIPAGKRTPRFVSNQYVSDKYLAYNFYLNPTASDEDDNSGKANYYNIIQGLIGRKNIINYSQITFEMKDTPYNVGYTSLATLNADSNLKRINDSYFTQFFQKLDSEIFLKKKDEKEKQDAQKKLLGDVDIITQTYYSFKNINDKWITGKNVVGYPYNKPNKRLIDSFAFVDRAMNPIGDTIINAEILVQMLEDPNISVFTALSQLLSLNGFEFFPLQNFMNVSTFKDNKSWESAFKIHTTGIDTEVSTAFVCMYIGGSSSYPSTSGNGFENDGIINIADPGVKDFSTKPPTVNNGNEDDKQTANNNEFPWRQVRAFRVRFGEQNQSMFTGIKIDSKDYPETNESIQILSRLAGDNKENAPIPKGQNLYNLYENRSYKATVMGLGNAMIQPTQYFQLENIPLFNGAYIILSVEHNISANKMTTSFSGTKLLKYPIPRVTSPASISGFNFGSSTGGEIVTAVLLSNNERTQYNSMYELKIE